MSPSTRCLGAGALALALARSAAAADAPADLVLQGGTVLTLEAGRPTATAVAVRGGRIVAVGTAADVQALTGAATRVIDVEGGLVLPGLTDAHVHVEGIGQARESLDLVGAESLAEVKERVARRHRELPAGEWLVGRGWDQNDWPVKVFPTAADLDAVAGTRPVFLERVDGHAAWVNTEALRLSGLGGSTRDPEGGRLIRDAKSEPTGVLIDAAQALVESHLPPPSPAVRKRWLEAGMRACAEAGLTSVHDAGVSASGVDLYKELLAEDRMHVRVYAMRRGPGEFLAAGPSLRPEIGLGDGRLTVRSIKVVADGALGSRGALLLAPYADEAGKHGLATVSWEELDRLVLAAIAQGFQVNTHAIGDAANRKVLDAYEKAFGAGGGAAHRFRIEHAQVLAPADVPRFKSLGVLPSMQPTHCTSDMYWATDRLGAERAKGAYLWKTFLKMGVPIPAGSDAPVESIAVLPGIYAAVTRQDAKGWPEGGWHPEERLSVLEAISIFARDAAFGAFEEKDRGTIAVGKRGDFTVLDRDITKGAAADILKARVKTTVVGGRVVHVAGTRGEGGV